MKRSPELRPTVWDALMALVVAALAVSCAFAVWRTPGTESALTAVVTVDGREEDRVLLTQETGSRSYTGNGYTLTVNFRPDGELGVRVEYADCPTQDCVHTGTITRAGQSIVCLPGRIIIQLEGAAEEDAPDVVIG